MRKRELKIRLEQDEKNLVEIVREFQKLEEKVSRLQKAVERQQITVDTVLKTRIKTQGDRIGRIEVKLGDMIKMNHQEANQKKQQEKQQLRSRKKHR